MTWKTLKSSFIVICTVVAAIVFTIVNEETPQVEHLAAVSRAHPLEYKVLYFHYV